MVVLGRRAAYAGLPSPCAGDGVGVAGWPCPYLAEQAAPCEVQALEASPPWSLGAPRPGGWCALLAAWERDDQANYVGKVEAQLFVCMWGWRLWSRAGIRRQTPGVCWPMGDAWRRQC